MAVSTCTCISADMITRIVSSN